MRGQTLIMADKQQSSADSSGFGQQQVDKSLLARSVKRRCRLIRDQYLGPTDERTCGGNPLLLANRKLGSRAIPEAGREVKALQQAGCFGRWIARPRMATRRESTGQQHVVTG